MGRWQLGLVMAAAGLAASAACSSFSGDSGTPSDEAGAPEAGAGADAFVDPSDAATNDADAAAPPCPSTAPVPTTFVSGAGAVSKLTHDASFLYWVAGPNDILRQNLATGMVEGVYTSTVGVTSLAVVGTNVLFHSGGGALYRVDAQADAGGLVYLGTSNPPSAANDTKVVAYTTYDDVVVSTPPGTLAGLVKQPGVIALAATPSNFFSLAPPDSGVGHAAYQLGATTATQVFYDPGKNPTQFAADGTELFMLDVDQGELFKAPLVPGLATTLATGVPSPNGVIVKTKQVYYATAQGIRRVDAKGGCLSTLSTTATSSFTVTDDRVYFVSGNDIVSVPR